MKLKIALMLVIVLVLSISTYNRNAIWKDPQILWEDVIAKAPNNARAYNNLGVAFKDEGKMNKAIEQFEKSLKTDKNYAAAAYFNLGDVQYRIGNYENAVAYLNQALTEKVASPQLHLDMLNKLGRTYSAMRQTDNAINAFKEAINVYPTAVAPYNNLGVQYIKAGKVNLAIETLEKALKIREEAYIRSNLSIAYDMREKTDEKTKNKPDIL
jgi:tetratricopeptide (TPR) repeat protein